MAKEKKNSPHVIEVYLLLLVAPLLTCLGIFFTWRMILLVSSLKAPLSFRLFILSVLFPFFLPSKGKVSRWNTLAHETAHAFIAKLVGNKVTKFKVSRDSGFVEYEYPPEHEVYTTSIALAPYWLPLLSGSALTLTAFLPEQVPFTVRTVIVGICYGLDMQRHLLELHRGQSDLSTRLGGFFFWRAYALLLNIFVFLFLSTWALGGVKYIGVLLLSSMKWLWMFLQ